MAASPFWFCLFMPVIALGLQVLPKVEKEFIVPKGTFEYAHTCSVAENPDGSLIIAYQAGQYEDSDDMAVYSQRRSADGGNWTKPVLTAKVLDYCTGGGVMWHNIYGRLFMRIMYGHSYFDKKCHTHHYIPLYMYSDDGGNTWSDFQGFPHDIYGPTRTPCITLTEGDSKDQMLCSSHTEALFRIGYYMSHAELTDQNLTEWKHSDDILGNILNDEICEGVIEPTVVEKQTSDNALMLMRSACGVIAQSTTTDGGKMWKIVSQSTGLPNPDSGICAVRMYGVEDELGFLLTMNNSTETRCPLTLAQSLDDAESWDHLMDIESDCSGYTYEYPTIIQSKLDPLVAHVCYSWHQTDPIETRSIVYARLSWDY